MRRPALLALIGLAAMGGVAQASKPPTRQQVHKASAWPALQLGWDALSSAPQLTDFSETVMHCHADTKFAFHCPVRIVGRADGVQPEVWRAVIYVKKRRHAFHVSSEWTKLPPAVTG